MILKRSKGKKIFGAALTDQEQFALELETRKVMAEYDLKNAVEVDAMVLNVLRKAFGFGPVRLRRFFEAFLDSNDELIDRYEIKEKDGDLIWLNKRELKEHGIDVDQWYKEYLEQKKVTKYEPRKT